MINTWKQGTASAPITIRAYPGHHPVIKPASTGNQFVVGFRQYPPNIMACYIVFDGFIINAADSPVFGIILEYAHHITIRNCEVKNTKNTWQAIYSRFNAENNTLDNVETHHNGNVGIHLLSANNTITNCIVHDNKMGGIVTSGSNSILKNTIHHNERNGIQTGADCSIYNNVVYSQPWNGVQVSGANCKVYNNTLVSNNGGIYLDAAATTCSVKNNIVTPNSSYTISDGGTGNTLSDNLTTGTPGFVDATNNDYHLTSTSIAIGVGENLTEFTDDRDGVARTSNYDQGAYEYFSSMGKTGESTETSKQTSLAQTPDQAVTVLVYPNPIKTQLLVNRKDANSSLTIEVYSILGQMVAQHEMTTGDTELTIRTDEWKDGIYFVKIHSGCDTDIIKVMKTE